MVNGETMFYNWIVISRRIFLGLLMLGLLISCGDNTARDNFETTVASIPASDQQQESAKEPSDSIETDRGDESEISEIIDSTLEAEENIDEILLPNVITDDVSSNNLTNDALDKIRKLTPLSNTILQQKDTSLFDIRKKAGFIRTALLVPMDGDAKDIGEDMQYGATLALFALGEKPIDMVFHNSSRDAASAVKDAINQQADIIVGPLFSTNTREIVPIAKEFGVPILSFSNDSVLAEEGVWLISQTPEQEIQAILNYALSQLKPAPQRKSLSIAIVMQDSDYGRRVSDMALKLLQKVPEIQTDILLLGQGTLDNEGALRASVRRFTNWTPPKSDNAGSDDDSTAFDAVIIAGDVPFSLRVAPVLSWYDLDSEKIRYLGTSLWGHPAILQEPSLQGAWFARLPLREGDFMNIVPPDDGRAISKYTMMAFDAVVLTSILLTNNYNALVDERGFKGFSGLFRFNEDGSTSRLLEIREIKSNKSKVILSAPESF